MLCTDPFFIAIANWKMSANGKTLNISMIKCRQFVDSPNIEYWNSLWTNFSRISINNNNVHITGHIWHKFKYMGQNRLLLSYIFHAQGDGLKFHRNIVNAFTWFKSKLNITCCGRTACNGILKMFIWKYDSYFNVSFMVMSLKCINSKKYPFMHYVCIGPFIKLEINFRHFGHGSIRISTKRAYDY